MDEVGAKEQEKEIVVIRLLRMEGTRAWVEHTLNHARVSKLTPIRVPGGEVKELLREEVDK